MDKKDDEGKDRSFSFFFGPYIKVEDRKFYHSRKGSRSYCEKKNENINMRGFDK